MGEVEKVNIEKRRKDLKILPPTKQPTRTKKRRQSNSKQTENERAFDKLHKQFDPSLVGTVPVNQIHAKSREQKKEQKTEDRASQHSLCETEAIKGGRTHKERHS